MKMFSTFAEDLKEHYSFKVKFKDCSRFMKFIATLLFFNKQFMTRFITTIGNTIYFPSEQFIKDDERVAMRALTHELIHIQQAKKYGRVLFYLMYLFPQCLTPLSVFALLAFVWTPCLWFLVFLVFCAPIPAPFRKKFELEACYMSIFIFYIDAKNSNHPDDEIQKNLSIWVLDLNMYNFRGANYYFMWPFGVVKELGNKVKEVRERDISDTDETYSLMKELYLKSVSAYE